jgi:hypothetical protein
MPFAVRFRGTQHCDAIFGTICYGHVWDWPPEVAILAAVATLPQLYDFL